MVMPSCLYRSVNEDEAVKNHYLGKLWFRSPAYFRTKEGPEADSLEGIGSYDVRGLRHTDLSDSIPIQAVFMMSFSAEAYATKKFGRHCLAVHDPQELLRRVKGALPPSITSVEWRKITYTKTTQVQRTLMPCEDWNRKYFQKPPHFSEEQEWRLFVLFQHSFRLLNNTMKVAVGNLQAVLRLESLD